VPNKTVTKVSLREVIDSREFNGADSKSAFAVGKNISGDCIIGNIAKLPHMLIAGTTGSGKSVCMNSIIISLLYKASPDDVKLIMVDPKMVELGIYNGIPHLLIPVVTDPKKAAGSLQWAVTEMLRRYRAMSDMGVRDLESYNSIIESQEIEGDKLPQIVVIIDELADLMLVAAKEVEESICRIAQMGRAAGIHLVIATQRPSADVITGLMKANIPSRIAFSVASAMESRIILDTQGAEKLVGRGDMLFAPIGTGKPQRVQGCFVSDAEVESVATYVKEHYNTNYDQSVMEEIEKTAAQTGSSKGSASDPEPNAEELDGDEMLPQAVDVILETGQASVSMLQRRLKLGYARAARIVDEMEEKGIVGPFQGSKPRAILITKAQWDAMRGGQNAQMDFADLDDGVDEIF
jgi:S-DNA-T family DNA segregation ATPase FtsK/SpoIIIE